MKKSIFILMAMLFVSSIAMSQNKANIKVSQKALTESLSPNEVVTKTLSIANQGGEKLTFSIVAVETSRSVDQGQPTVGSSTKDLPGQEIDYILERVKNGRQNAAWLKINQTTTSIAPSGSSQIEFAFDAKGLVPDIYTARVLISSNDQDNPYEIVPVTLTVVLGPMAGCQAFQTTDNENNAGTGTADNDIDVRLCQGHVLFPMELNLFLDDAGPISSAQLSVYAHDIDETAGETDHVYFNGNFCGALTGNDGLWSTTVFNINPAWVVPGPAGKNTVQVYNIVSGWCLTVDWVQLLVNNCGTGNANLRYVNLDETCYTPGSTVGATIEVDTDLASQSVKVETNLLDENGIAVDGAVNTYTVFLTADEPLSVNLDVPAGANLGVTYNVQVIVYDAGTNLQQDYLEVPLLVNNPCTQPVPVSNWAIILGVFLIGAFMVVRYRRRLA